VVIWIHTEIVGRFGNYVKGLRISGGGGGGKEGGYF